jgi:hypothetical protein
VRCRAVVIGHEIDVPAVEDGFDVAIRVRAHSVTSRIEGGPGAGGLEISGGVESHDLAMRAGAVVPGREIDITTIERAAPVAVRVDADSMGAGIECRP